MPILPKKKSWTNGHFWTKTMDSPLWKNVNILTFWTSCFYSLKKRFFVLEYRKSQFPGQYCLKKKTGKIAIFGPKTMGLEKCQFLEFWSSCFYSLERRFFVLEYRKTHFNGLYCLKKRRLKKCPFLDQNHGLTPLEICQLFDLFYLLFL